jgi:hypothetical protein
VIGGGSGSVGVVVVVVSGVSGTELETPGTFTVGWEAAEEDAGALDGFAGFPFRPAAGLGRLGAEP